MVNDQDKTVVMSATTVVSTGVGRMKVLLCFIGLILMNLMAAIDATALSVALPVCDLIGPVTSV
jgi:hypothetical protein